ncbi:hypothetical protein HMPREF3227_00268 [Corynebacterium sp. CMW7794]|uniref:DUF4307 domain-containing protein n=1 Tax=Corynebacterium phoceense TaxID=1686286 RepID=A0A540R527_9CORY|nr:MULTISPECIES: DUF4307 domain-containing protein [Corynebacterium]KXB53825.1 hypothetical protein HMPREF0307_01798 [Corynebacterium sp. DNF00584]KXI19649.1 hypothetical protein HMPREF3227_00268 [Corynebacterium sp. CMW7794]MBF9010337.1 DUF4307 domain-containing protein [Corynebacterium phoceense]MCQ9330252.1 DUF4307 domain-containing protein [Corynebacterium phoceense]MCQ9340043.1 DUF4307 domain-containing protein [Corynebacterium phoceense]
MSTSDGGQSRRSARYAERTNHESREDSFNITSKAIALVFVAVIIATIFYGFRYFQSREQTNAEISMVTQQIISDDTTRVWADITRSRPEEAAYCILVAYDYEKVEVGRREIALAPDGKESIRVSVDVPTNARAVAGGVYGCSSLVPPYLDTENPQYNVES